MEIKRAKYAIVDTTKIASVKTGQIVSHAELEDTAKENGVENGMLLGFDQIEGKVTIPTDKGEEVYLHWSEETDYVGGTPRNEFKEHAFPRLFKLHVDDVFETNAVNGDVVKGHYATTDASDGYIEMAGEAMPEDAGVVLRVLNEVVLNNGENGAEFIVVKAGGSK